MLDFFINDGQMRPLRHGQAAVETACFLCFVCFVFHGGGLYTLRKQAV